MKTHKPDLRPCTMYALVLKKNGELRLIDGPFRNEDEVLNMEGSHRYYITEIPVKGKQRPIWKWDCENEQWISLTIKVMYGIGGRYDGELRMKDGPTEDLKNLLATDGDEGDYVIKLTGEEKTDELLYYWDDDTDAWIEL